MLKPGLLIPWKLIFRVNRIDPGTTCTCVVQPRCPFRGSYFMFMQAESFALSGYLIGNVVQIPTADPVPCLALHTQSLSLSVSMTGQHHTILVKNIGSNPAEFLAELHGKMFLRHDEEEPHATEWEKRSYLVQ